VNYAAFLEENEYFEESFKVYERGVELFTYPVSFEIWNIYLSKFMKRYVGYTFRSRISLIPFQGGSKLERTRDLFEQSLEKCPPKFCKSIFILYAQLEEEHGLAKRAMAVYERAAEVVVDKDKFEVIIYHHAFRSQSHPFSVVSPLYCQSKRQLRPACNSAHIRKIYRSSPQPTGCADVHTVCRAGEEAR
jgi:pre-mRNA-splicing factor SYF1